MSKLFLFGIGGTGSRVIKSLTMLLASGVEINAEKVIPIIIDPDASNGDMLECIEVLKTYQRIHNLRGKEADGFFRTDVVTLGSLASSSGMTNSIGNAFILKLADTLGKPFGDFINYLNLQEEDKHLVNLLYTNKNLEDDLTKGFLGNPNVGSVVLNTLEDTAEFQFFASNFQPGDRIFIISSIFGGTGASGFPLLLKIFKNPDGNFASVAALNDAIIGGVTVMPYFNLAPSDQSNIDSNNFITKTKAALSYYINNLKGLDSLYYIGDAPLKAYENVDGGSKQKNLAHPVEMLSALAVIDFMSQTNFDGNTQFYEYALQSQTAPAIFFDNFGPATKNLIGKKLTMFKYLSLHLKEHVRNGGRDKVWAKQNKIDNQFLSSSFYKDVELFVNTFYEDWLNQLSANDRKFLPFDQNVKVNDLTQLINQKPVQKGFFQSLDYDTFDKKLNKLKSNNNAQPEAVFLELWYKASEEILNEKLRNF